MILLQSAKAFDLHMLLLGEEDWSFLPEVLLRSAIMFVVAIIALRLIGKRGIMQGVFELVTIITLGSAAGDPMFYKKVGLLPACLVFLTIIIMYRLINFFVSRSEKFEHLIEGRHIRLIKERRFATEDVNHQALSKDEILADLRLYGVSHLGQVDAAYIEASGEVSVFFLPDDQVDFGLPIIPELYEAQLKTISESGVYSCSYCGFTKQMEPIANQSCEVCDKTNWVKSICSKRIT